MWIQFRMGSFCFTNRPPLIQKTSHYRQEDPTDLIWSKKRHFTNRGIQPTSFGAKTSRYHQGSNRPYRCLDVQEWFSQILFCSFLWRFPHFLSSHIEAFNCILCSCPHISLNFDCDQTQLRSERLRLERLLCWWFFFIEHSSFPSKRLFANAARAIFQV